MTYKAEYQVIKTPSTRWGLLNEFTLTGAGQGVTDDQDWSSLTIHCEPEGGIFSARNREHLKAHIQPWMKCVVEIGVSFHGYELSSSKTLIDSKPDGCAYFGIDIGDREFVRENGTDVYVIRNTSADVENNMNTIRSISGCEYIDFLHIDGWHSVDAVRADWDYAKYVRPNGGVIAIHDTNSHPGPCALMQCIDPDCFSQILTPCEVPNDYGLTILIRK